MESEQMRKKRTETASYLTGPAGEAHRGVEIFEK